MMMRLCWGWAGTSCVLIWRGLELVNLGDVQKIPCHAINPVSPPFGFLSAYLFTPPLHLCLPNHRWRITFHSWTVESVSGLGCTAAVKQQVKSVIAAAYLSVQIGVNDFKAGWTSNHMLTKFQKSGHYKERNPLLAHKCIIVIASVGLCVSGWATVNWNGTEEKHKPFAPLNHSRQWPAFNIHIHDINNMNTEQVYCRYLPCSVWLFTGKHSSFLRV